MGEGAAGAAGATLFLYVPPDAPLTRRAPTGPEMHDGHREVQSPVRFVVKSRADTHVTLVWKAPVGEPVIHFELDKVPGAARAHVQEGAEHPVFTGLAETFKVTDLAPRTPYVFHLFTVTSSGKSEPASLTVNTLAHGNNMRYSIASSLFLSILHLVS